MLGRAASSHDEAAQAIGRILPIDVPDPRQRFVLEQLAVPIIALIICLNGGFIHDCKAGATICYSCCPAYLCSIGHSDYIDNV